MNKREFMKELAALDVDFSVQHGAIRCALGFCPIEAVARKVLKGRFDSGKGVYMQAEYLGLNSKTADIIADAADYESGDEATRQQLLKALRLS